MSLLAVAPAKAPPLSDAPHANEALPLSAGAFPELRRPSASQTISAADAYIFKKSVGYAPVLYRGFTGVMSFSFCFVSVSVLPSLATTMSTGLTNGGPAVIVWGWIIVAALSVLSGASLAEICSAYPTAGAV